MAENRDNPRGGLEFQTEMFANYLVGLGRLLDETASVNIETDTIGREPGMNITGLISFPHTLVVRFDYVVFLDPETGLLTVDNSTFSVIRGAKSSEPLVRWDYIRSPRSSIPCAHVQVHAHRDEWTHALVLGGSHSRRSRRRIKNEARTPRIADVHFPVGGRRFRPCIEEVLLFVIDEFGVACAPQAREALHQGIREWENIQLRAAVRHNRASALEILES